MQRRSLLLAASAAALNPSLMTAAEGGETGVFERAEPSGATREPQQVYYHRPAGWKADGRIVMVLHGLDRNAAGYRNGWIASAERYGFLLICPEFARSKFPGSAWYNQGGLERTSDPAMRSFAVPDRVFTDACARFGASAPRFSLYGHSAGSQFLHRMQLLAPSARVDATIAANAAYYTLPVFDSAYPYGLAGTGATEDQIARFLSWPLVLLLGEADTDPEHRTLVRNAEADKQGMHRFARGMNYLEVGKQEATRRGLTLAWRVATVPGAGHNNRHMAASAAAHLFG